MLPLTLFWDDNRLFTETGQVFAVYRLPKLPYEHQPESAKRQAFSLLSTFFRFYTGKGQFLSLCQVRNSNEVMEPMLQFSSHPDWYAHVGRFADILESGSVFQRINFLILPIDSTGLFDVGYLMARPDLIAKRLEEAGRYGFRVAKKSVSTKWRKIRGNMDEKMPVFVEKLEEVKNAEKRLREKIRTYLPGAIPALTSEMEFIHRSPYFRGIGQTPETFTHQLFEVETEDDAAVIRPYPVRGALDECIVHKDTFRIRVEHPDGRISHQSVMALPTIPKVVTNIGMEWIYQNLEVLNFPVDVAIPFEIHRNERAKRKLERRKKVTQGHIKDFKNDKQDVPVKLSEGLSDAHELEIQLHQGAALSTFSVFLALGASTEKEMMRREAEVKKKYSSIGTLVNPPDDALKIWQTFFPGNMERLYKTWQIPGNADVLAGSGLLGTMEISDEKGQYFGYNAYNRSPVMIDWWKPMMVLNKSGMSAFVGELGSGKSTAMKYAIDAMIQWGAYGMIIDPKKGEYRYLLNLYPDATALWDFGAGSNMMFTPFRVSDKKARCREIAEGFLHVLLNVSADRDGQFDALVLGRALDVMYAKETEWDMDHFLPLLRSEQRSDEEKKRAEILSDTIIRLRNSENGRTIFGKDTGEFGLVQKRVTIISTVGLDFPDANDAQEKWRISQRFAVAVLYLVTQLGMERIVLAPQSMKKFFGVDEGWILRSLPEGRSMLDKFALMGRSMNLVLMLALINPEMLMPHDANDDYTGNLAWLFIGRLTSDIQIKHAMKLLKLPEDSFEYYKQYFLSFGKKENSEDTSRQGMGFLRNPDGRVAVTKVHIIPEERLPLFENTPGKSA